MYENKEAQRNRKFTEVYKFTDKICRKLQIKAKLKTKKLNLKFNKLPIN